MASPGQIIDGSSKMHDHILLQGSLSYLGEGDINMGTLSPPTRYKDYQEFGGSILDFDEFCLEDEPFHFMVVL